MPFGQEARSGLAFDGDKELQEGEGARPALKLPLKFSGSRAGLLGVLPEQFEFLTERADKFGLAQKENVFVVEFF